jgi:lysocardiolipin and lysophospholipid acyltransferase
MVAAALRIAQAVLVLAFLMLAMLPNLIAMLVAKVVLARSKFTSFATGVQRRYLLVFTWFLELPRSRRIVFSGDVVPSGESALVVPNHAAAHGDFAPLYALAARSGGLGSVKTVSKDVLKYVPCFGWGMWLMQWPFLKREWVRDRKSLEGTLRLYREAQQPLLMWLFAEGTRWTPEKHAQAVAFARSRSQYEPAHTLVPKPTGFTALVHGLDGLVTHVHDVTLAYSGSPVSKRSRGPGFVQLFAPAVEKKVQTGEEGRGGEGKACTFHVHVRRIPLKDLPLGDDAALKQWLFELFRGKDELLKQFQRDGRFPGEQREPPLEPGAKVQVLLHVAAVALLLGAFGALRGWF